jgi:hypothetical protein
MLKAKIKARKAKAGNLAAAAVIEVPLRICLSAATPK